MLNHLLTFAIFFAIGIEIRDGLSHVKEAIGPIIAAIGGMVAPAIIFLLLQPGSHLWAVVMPTDVALALGVLALIGKRAPQSARLFLMTLAVADDFFTLVVMGVFYSQNLSFTDAFFTIGAAIIGFLIPFGSLILRFLNPLITYLVVPAYIWVNLLSKLSFYAADFSLPSAIIASRIIGKVLGITLAAILLHRYTRVKLPADLSGHAIIGIGLLCGMGMTVSLVIAEIAEKSEPVLDQVRSGLFISAFVSALLALSWFRFFPGSIFVLDELRNNPQNQ